MVVIGTPETNNINLAAPGPIGATSPAPGEFTELSATTTIGLGQFESYASPFDYILQIGSINETSVNAGRAYAWQLSTPGNQFGHDLVVSELRRSDTDVEFVSLDGTPAQLTVHVVLRLSDGQLRPESDTITAFRFQNAAGAATALVIDTLNNRLNTPTMPTFANDPAADAALNSGDWYQITGDRTIYRKP